jgi:hypothetical protein
LSFLLFLKYIDSYVKENNGSVDLRINNQCTLIKSSTTCADGDLKLFRQISCEDVINCNIVSKIYAFFFDELIYMHK